MLRYVHIDTSTSPYVGILVLVSTSLHVFQ